jgi:hypothetical protein
MTTIVPGDGPTASATMFCSSTLPRPGMTALNRSVRIGSPYG